MLCRFIAARPDICSSGFIRNGMEFEIDLHHARWNSYMDYLVVSVDKDTGRSHAGISGTWVSVKCLFPYSDFREFFFNL